MKRNYNFFGSVFLLVSLSTSNGCNTLRQNNGNSEILKTIQGRWILYQNNKEELLVKKDTLFRYFDNKLNGKYIIKISSEIISKIFENDTIKGNDKQWFFEEVNPNTGEIENQYAIISVEKNKFVMSPIHRSDLLTYDRKTKSK